MAVEALARGSYRIVAAAAVAVLASCGGGSTDSDPPGAPATSAGALVHALAVTPAQAALAKWSAPVMLSLVPVSGAVLATGKVLLWAGDYPSGDSYGGSGTTYATLFDPVTGLATDRKVTETLHDMFCPGTARLADGRILVNGGSNANATSLYDAATDTWTRAPAMNVARGYNASATLGDGSVFTLGGSWSGGQGGKPAEVYTPGAGWRALANVNTNDDKFMTADPRGYYRADNHMWLLSTGNGRVLHAGPSRTMSWIDPRGDGSATPAGTRGDDTDSMNGNAVMYDAGKILTVGGSIAYDNDNNTFGKSSAYAIDLTGGTAQVRKLAPMAYPRMYGNSVVLPTGQVVVIGGQTQVVVYSDSNGVLPAELWDPQTETFTVLPPMSVARNYHSIAMLLPDGRVLSAGGGLCFCAGDHPNLQILSPPYLYNADGSAAARPAVTGAPATWSYGSTVTVSTDAAVSAFALVRLGATTHTVDNDQRRIALSHTGGAGNSYQVSVPTNPGLLLPGQWMLFAVNANGTPSVAKFITVSNANAPVLQNPGDIAAATGAPLSIPIAATTPAGALSFSAAGLPQGLSIDATTGTISGSVATPGRYLVVVRATNGVQTVSTDVALKVEAPGAGTGLQAQYFGNGILTGTPLASRAELPNIGIGTAGCAAAGAACAVAGTRIVSYGANGAYASKTVTGSIDCSDAAFGGDPAPGYAKACYVGLTGVPDAASTALFSTRWTGSVEAVATGTTQFRLLTGTGARLWVNGQLLVDTTVAGASTVGSVQLVSGQRYPVLIEYVQSAGALSLQWGPAGDALVPVPATRLYPTVPSGANLAQGRPATQSSTAPNGDAAGATDGNIDGNAFSGSISGTAGSAPQDWWQVDLGRRTRLDLVQLWNRSDCCGDRLANFYLLVSDTDMSGRTLTQLLADPSVTARKVGATSIAPTLGIPVGVAGRYARVQLAGTNPLSLAEVQVFGDATVYQTPSVAAVPNQQTSPGVGVSLAIRGSDPGGNPLVYAASGLPAGLGIDAQSGLISGTPTATGTRSVVVSVTNGGGLSASTGFVWTVLGSLPQVGSTPAPIATSGSAVNYNPPASGGSSPQYSWNFGDGSADTAYASAVATSHVYAAPGVYTVTLSIRGGDGQTATQRFVQAVVAAGATAQARASSTLLLEPRGSGAPRLWVVNADNDSVSVFDTGSNARLAEIPVGLAPRTLALAPDGRVWVANKHAASLSVVDPGTLAVAQTVRLPRGSQPHGIVAAPDGSLYVALEATGQLLKLNAAGSTVATLAVGDAPRHLTLTANGAQLLVSRFITRPLPGEGTANVATTDAAGAKLGGEVLVVNPATLALGRTVVLAHSERADGENQGRGIPNYLGAAAVSPDGRTAWVPGKQDNVKRGTLRDGHPLDFQSTVRSISARIDLGSYAEDLAGRLDHDNAGFASAAVYHPSGAYLFVALETNRQVAVVDAAGKRELFRYEVGLAPQGLAVSADGQRLYVQNFMGRSVSVLDLGPLVGYGLVGTPNTATLATVAADKLPPAVLRGKQLFYDARDTRLAKDSYMSCASCHHDGGHDGRTWDLTSLGEGLRNTPALRGRAGAEGLLHWSGNFDEVQDFEGQIRALAGGTGLMADSLYNAGTRSQPLGDRKAGLSADLDALAAYVGSLTTFLPSPYRSADGAPTAAALAGRTVFAANCASCHGGAAFTASADAASLRNVGTLKASSGKRLGGPLTGIDIPTLRDAWATAPYLHDGSAPTLAAAVAAHTNLALGAADLANVVAYVQQLGGDEPLPATNLALGRPATQSTVAFDGYPGRAVDGNTGGVYGNGSITHTAGDAQPWWQVDLGQPSTIQSVQLWNRTDCCAERLANVYVLVSPTDMTGRTLTQLTADASVAKVQVASLNGAASVNLPIAAQGRYVRVQLGATGTSYLSLAEVQVLGLPSVNLAQGRNATQSSDAFGGYAPFAVDGRTDGIYNDQSVSHTGAYAAQDWWQVDLGRVAALDAVQLWNRTDCCADRLSSFYMLASATDMTGRSLAQLLADPGVLQIPVTTLAGSPVLALPLTGVNARYLRVQLSGLDALSLAEVQVHGR